MHASRTFTRMSASAAAAAALVLPAIAMAQDDDIVCCRGFYGENEGFMSRESCVSRGGDVADRSFCLAGGTIFGDRGMPETPPDRNEARPLEELSDTRIAVELEKLWPGGKLHIADVRAFDPNPPQLAAAELVSPYAGYQAQIDSPTESSVEPPDSDVGGESKSGSLGERLLNGLGEALLEEAQRVSPGLDPRLDVEGFADDVHAALADETVGYRLQVQRGGEIVETRQWRYARKPADGVLFWNGEVSIHLASTSKMITAAALIRAIRERGLNLDDRIIDHLPTYWSRGGNVHLITFRHLLAHKSGLGGWPGDFDSGGAGYRTARTHIENGVGPAPNHETGDWRFAYKNSNYALARILIAVLTTDINRSYTAFSESATDLLWDAATANAYERYVRDVIFEPAGVTGASLSKRDKTALAYRANPNGVLRGWNSGDMASAAGPIGWHLTTDELLAVGRLLRTPGAVISTEDFAAMLYEGMGFFPSSQMGDLQGDLDDLQLFQHGGRWGSGVTEQAERNALFFAPGDIEIAIMVNSDYRAYFDAVIAAYKANLHDPVSP